MGTNFVSGLRTLKTIKPKNLKTCSEKPSCFQPMVDTVPRRATTQQIKGAVVHLQWWPSEAGRCCLRV